MKPDSADISVFGGLALIGLGLWLIYPPLTLVTMGIALIAFGIIATSKGKK